MYSFLCMKELGTPSHSLQKLCIASKKKKELVAGIHCRCVGHWEKRATCFQSRALGSAAALAGHPRSCLLPTSIGGVWVKWRGSHKKVFLEVRKKKEKKKTVIRPKVSKTYIGVYHHLVKEMAWMVQPQADEEQGGSSKSSTSHNRRRHQPCDASRCKCVWAWVKKTAGARSLLGPRGDQP